MKTRTLVSTRLYFGLEPLILRRGAERTLARIARLPPKQARVNAQTLREDFQLDMAEAHALLRALVLNRLVQSGPGRAGDYQLTERFHEYALARVVLPLTHVRAKELLEAVCELAARMNADGTRNPLMIDMIAVSGSYMSRGDRIAELVLWPVVRARPRMPIRRFQASMTKTEGSKEIGAALRALSSFIVVNIVTDTAPIERPFSVPFRADDDGAISSPSTSPFPTFRTWGTSIRRQLTGR